MNPLHIISLGAGVQSSTMALMATHGEIEPMPTAAIFADTGGEPRRVYEWLDWLRPRLKFPVYTVQKGNLRSDSLYVGTSKNDGKPYVRTLIPAFIPGRGLLNRSCTRDYKINPIRRKVKELCNIKGRFPKDVRAIQWIGISIDEVHRMKVQLEGWQELRHPLIEKRMSRADCFAWMQRKGYPEPPRSACTFCPFHSNEEWRKLTPAEFAEAAEFEQELQTLAAPIVAIGKLKGLPYLHRDCVPLTEVDLSTAEEHGQVSWLDECDGVCGV